MAQFATADDLADRLGVEFTAAQEVRADALLTIASDLVQGEARQTIELVEDDTLTLIGQASHRIRLPQRPVVSVASVTLDGVALTEGEAWYRDGDELVRLPVPYQSAFPSGWSGVWGAPDQPLVIVYTHGYATIPGAVKAIVLEAAARVWFNPGSVMSERLGQAQITYAVQGTPAGALLTQSERQTLREMFRRTAGTVTLR